MTTVANLADIDGLVDEISRRVVDRLRCQGFLPEAPEQAQEKARSPMVAAASAQPPASSPPIPGVDAELAARIDHTLLKPGSTREELVKVCREARKYGFATVCVNSANIPLVAGELWGSPVMPIAVVGFPLGEATPQAKAFEAREAIAAGAREIDMVINLGQLKSKDYRAVTKDIEAVVEAATPHPVKVILETSQLTDEEKVIACALAKTAGAAFVKTSTGFAGGGATVEDIVLMRRVVGPEMGVKASGGVRTRQDALKMIEAGADRIGASASVAIVTLAGLPQNPAGTELDDPLKY